MLFHQCGDVHFNLDDLNSTNNCVYFDIFTIIVISLGNMLSVDVFLPPNNFTFNTTISFVG